jgi:ketosteroid isomerase-like protein
MICQRFFLGAVLLCAAAKLAVAQETVTQEELLRRSQELFDSVITGNKEPWQKYYADDAVFFDEKGRSMDKTALVADISPLPTGYSGKIKIGKAASRIIGDTAVVSYDVDETETIFGQNLSARYHATDTWLRRNGAWQIIATQVLRYYEDPAVGKIDSNKLSTFAGTYELAPGQTRTVTTDSGKLFVERKGKKEELFPETADIFFRKGVEGRILFRSDDKGKIDALIDRRNNEDVVWRKAER